MYLKSDSSPCIAQPINQCRYSIISGMNLEDLSESYKTVVLFHKFEKELIEMSHVEFHHRMIHQFSFSSCSRHFQILILLLLLQYQNNDYPQKQDQWQQLYWLYWHESHSSLPQRLGVPQLLRYFSLPSPLCLCIQSNLPNSNPPLVNTSNN